MLISVLVDTIASQVLPAGISALPPLIKKPKIHKELER